MYAGYDQGLHSTLRLPIDIQAGCEGSIWVEYTMEARGGLGRRARLGVNLVAPVRQAIESLNPPLTRQWPWLGRIAEALVYVGPRIVVAVFGYGQK